MERTILDDKVNNNASTQNQNKRLFYGSITALVTPFTSEDMVDEKAFRSFVEWQICEGSDGLVVTGTTGEAFSLHRQERYNLIRSCVDVSASRVPVIVGAGSNNTRETIDFVCDAEKAGADGLLLVTPYYNKPKQKGLYAHYTAVAQSTSLPILLYNIPGRSCVDLLPETLAALIQACPTIVGIKDSTGQMERVSQQRFACGKDWIQLSGDDFSALSFNAQGGVGCISVLSNVVPRLCSQLQKLSREGEREKALAVYDRLLPLCEAIFLESGASGVKYALSCLGFMENKVRLPLMNVDQKTAQNIDAAMARLL